MLRSVCVLLLVAVAMLKVTEGAAAAAAADDGGEMMKMYMKGVNLAVQQINSHTSIQNHFLFYKSVKRSSVEAGFNVKYFYHHFYLKATKCSRGTENADVEKCDFRNDRPLIDCTVCYKTFAGEIEGEPKPYIHCVQKPALTQEMENQRIDHCNKMSYSNGVSTLLASIGSS